MENKLHQLRHGRQTAALREIAALPKGRRAVAPIVRREQNYFAEHACRMNYQTIARRGWPSARVQWNQRAFSGRDASNVPDSFGPPAVWPTYAR